MTIVVFFVHRLMHYLKNRYTDSQSAGGGLIFLFLGVGTYQGGDYMSL